MQVIQPRVVRAIVLQQSAKTPEANLEKQLECNPSFTPRIISCPPFSHNPHVMFSNLTKSNTSSANTLVPSVSTQTLTQINATDNTYFNSNSEVKSSLQFIPQCANSTMYNSRLNQIGETNNSSSGDETDQKFNSLNVKKDQRNEPQFSSMKMVRKRKLERFYPDDLTKIDYVLVNKNDRIFKDMVRSDDVIYANYPNLFYTSVSSPEIGLPSNSLIIDSMNASFQNLTDSIQIYENSPFDSNKKNRSNKSDKTPTPAPRTGKSPAKVEHAKKKSPREHVYANLSSQIGLLNVQTLGIPVKRTNSTVKSLKQGFDSTDGIFKSGFIPIGETPKTLPRKPKNEMKISNKESEKPVNTTQFISLTFPKRTTKSGILDEKPSAEVKKTESMKEGKLKSSKMSRNHSFNDTNQLKEDSKQIKKVFQYELQKIQHLPKVSPSIVDTTPKIKPPISTKKDDHIPFKFGPTLQSLKQQSNVQFGSKTSVKPLEKTPVKKMELKFGSDTQKLFETIDKKTESKINSNTQRFFDGTSNSAYKLEPDDAKNIGKVVPKQHVLKPDKPLQIPNLLAKPIPKNPIHSNNSSIRRSQSNLSSKGASKYRQQFKEATNTSDGSLVKAKIRELNFRQVFV